MILPFSHTSGWSVRIPGELFSLHMLSLPEAHNYRSIYVSNQYGSALYSAMKNSIFGQSDIAMWLWFWPVLSSHTSLGGNSGIDAEWCYLCLGTWYCAVPFVPNNNITALILLFLGQVSFFQIRAILKAFSNKMSPVSKDLFKLFLFILTEVSHGMIRESFQPAVL